MSEPAFPSPEWGHLTPIHAGDPDRAAGAGSTHSNPRELSGAACLLEEAGMTRWEEGFPLVEVRSLDRQAIDHLRTLVGAGPGSTPFSCNQSGQPPITPRTWACSGQDEITGLLALPDAWPGSGNREEPRAAPAERPVAEQYRRSGQALSRRRPRRPSENRATGWECLRQQYVSMLVKGTRLRRQRIPPRRRPGKEWT
jgi:hypothetical protein